MQIQFRGSTALCFSAQAFGVRQTQIGIPAVGHWANHLTTVSHNCLICKLRTTLVFISRIK